MTFGSSFWTKALFLGVLCLFNAGGVAKGNEMDLSLEPAEENTGVDLTDAESTSLRGRQLLFEIITANTASTTFTLASGATREFSFVAPGTIGTFTTYYLVMSCSGITITNTIQLFAQVSTGAAVDITGTPLYEVTQDLCNIGVTAVQIANGQTWDIAVVAPSGASISVSRSAEQIGATLTLSTTAVTAAPTSSPGSTSTPSPTSAPTDCNGNSIISAMFSFFGWGGR